MSRYFLLCYLQIRRCNGNCDVLFRGNAVLTLLHFVKKHIVVLLPILVKPVACGLQEYLVSELVLIDYIVVQRNLNIVACIKAVEQITVGKEYSLLFRTVRSVVCYIGKRVGDGVVVGAYLKNVLAADVFVGDCILHRSGNFTDFILYFWFFRLLLL